MFFFEGIGDSLFAAAFVYTLGIALKKTLSLRPPFTKSQRLYHLYYE